MKYFIQYFYMTLGTVNKMESQLFKSMTRHRPSQVFIRDRKAPFLLSTHWVR